MLSHYLPDLCNFWQLLIMKTYMRTTPYFPWVKRRLPFTSFPKHTGNVGLKEELLSQLWLQSFHKPRDPFVQGCCAKVWSGNATALAKPFLAPHARGGGDVNVANLLWMLFHRAQKCHWSPCTEDMQGLRCCKFPGFCKKRYNVCRAELLCSTVCKKKKNKKPHDFLGFFFLFFLFIPSFLK